MERREFIRTSCSFCLLAGSTLLAGELASCNPWPIYDTVMTNHTVTVPLSLFAESHIQIVRPKDFAYDIAVQKQSDDQFVALLLQCTHADNPLNFDGSTFNCQVHGSTFDRQGEVTHGPAARSLTRMKIRILRDKLIVQV